MPTLRNSSTPITEYVQDTSAWEDWKRDYQFGAFYIFPPAELRTKVNKLREEFDPKSQSYCDAHISLTVPLPRAVYQEGWERFCAALREVKPFSVQYGPPTSYPGIPGVVLAINPADQFEMLVKTLEAVSTFSGAKPRHHTFSPHMTIAEFITLERTEELVKSLSKLGLQGEFTCDSIDYAVPDKDFHFSERGFIKFGS